MKCREIGDCDSCPEWKGAVCGMADDFLALMDTDEAAILEMARQYEAAKCCVLELTSFKPGYEKLRVGNRLREKLNEMGFKYGHGGKAGGGDQ